MTLQIGHAYWLKGMKRSMWQVPSPTFGCPERIVGIYLGSLQGTRKWYGFEIQVRKKDRGVIFMPESDLILLRVEAAEGSNNDNARRDKL